MPSAPGRDESLIPPEGFVKEVLWLPSLFVKTNVISDTRFEQCRLVGPAVIALLGDSSLIGCDLPGPFEAFFWEIPAEREMVFGAVAFVNCEFVGCRFDDSVGLAGPRELGEALRGNTTG